MQGENGEQRLLQCPICSVITQDVVVVPQIFWQGMEFHKLVLHSAPQVAGPISGASQLTLLLFLTSIHTLPPPHAHCVPIPIPIILPIPHLPHLSLLPRRRRWVTLSPLDSRKLCAVIEWDQKHTKRNRSTPRLMFTLLQSLTSRSLSFGSRSQKIPKPTNHSTKYPKISKPAAAPQIQHSLINSPIFVCEKFRPPTFQKLKQQILNHP